MFKKELKITKKSIGNKVDVFLIPTLECNREKQSVQI